MQCALFRGGGRGGDGECVDPSGVAGLDWRMEEGPVGSPGLNTPKPGSSRPLSQPSTQSSLHLLSVNQQHSWARRERGIGGVI